LHDRVLQMAEGLGVTYYESLTLHHSSAILDGPSVARTA
jgi:hypothetical protein